MCPQVSLARFIVIDIDITVFLKIGVKGESEDVAGLGVMISHFGKEMLGGGCGCGIHMPELGAFGGNEKVMAIRGKEELDRTFDVGRGREAEYELASALKRVTRSPKKPSA